MATQVYLPLIFGLLHLATSNLQMVHSSYCDYQPTSPYTSNLTVNQIDSCWRTTSNWAANRSALADCAVGFGKDAIGGKNGAIYNVTDPSDDQYNPKHGTLRFGVIQIKPLWITFERDMNITLKNELMVSSYKTIDGRGAKVEISNGPCITIARVNHVIIHGISIYNCRQGKPGRVKSSPTQKGHRRGSDGDGISIYRSSHIWIDHCSLSSCADGLIDVIHASTAITISNNYFTDHDKVMLFGASDKYIEDKIMRVTVVFNHFGSGLIQRIPRVRLGYAHIANNRYDEWEMYAIGGSANPTILSEGNFFTAPDNPKSKQVTKREVKSNYGWRNWNWTSSKDVFMNGACFVSSGNGSCSPLYSQPQSFLVSDGSMVPSLTSDAGPLDGLAYRAC